MPFWPFGRSKSRDASSTWTRQTPSRKRSYSQPPESTYTSYAPGSSPYYYGAYYTPAPSYNQAPETRGRSCERTKSSRSRRAVFSPYYYGDSSSKPTRPSQASSPAWSTTAGYSRPTEDRRGRDRRGSPSEYDYSTSTSRRKHSQWRAPPLPKVNWGPTEVQGFYSDDSPASVPRSRSSSRAASGSSSPSGILRNSKSSGVSRAPAQDYPNAPWLNIPARDSGARRSRSSSKSRNSSPGVVTPAVEHYAEPATYGYPWQASPYQHTTAYTSQPVGGTRKLKKTLSQDRLRYLAQQSQTSPYYVQTAPMGQGHQPYYPGSSSYYNYYYR